MTERHAFNQEKEKKIVADIIFKVEKGSLEVAININ